MTSFSLFSPKTSGAVECLLCPKLCLIVPGQVGDCRVRVNIDGKLTAVVYGRPVSMHIDPVEKKPLYHFKPGTPILSVATAGCNLHCLNCQNWELSQVDPWDTKSYRFPPADLIELARKKNCPSVAYTYSDPIAFYEYTLDSCIKAHEFGVKNVLVTAGFANPEPLKNLYAHADAANIDLKSMSNQFYRDICRAELKPVLNSLRIAKEQGVWVEVTNLLIPTLNDEPKMIAELANFIVNNLDADTPLHFSAFTPRYKLKHLPSTPKKTLLMARDIARQAGVNHVYIGNLLGTEGSNTYCPNDGALVIERIGYRIIKNKLDSMGRCPECSKPVAGVWQ